MSTALLNKGFGSTSDCLVLGGFGGGEEAPVLVTELSCDMRNGAEFEVEPDQRAATMTTGCDMVNGARLSARAFRDTVSGAVPGSVLELYASRAALGVSPGINAPLSTTWTDLSGNGNHGTLTGFDGQAPWVGTGTPSDPYRLVFDPANGNFVVMPDLSAAEDKTFAYEAWFMTTSAGLGLFVGEGGASIDYVCLGVSAGKLWSRYRAAGAVATRAGAATVNDGLLHHAELVCDGANGQLYLDGVPDGAAFALPAGTPVLTTTYVGAVYIGYVDLLFAGSIPLARIHPFALTPEQVAQNYAAGVAWPPFSTGLPETDTLGWTTPDAAASPLWDLTVTIGGQRIPNAAITSFPIELDAHGGFESCAISFASKRTRRWPRRAQIVVDYDGMHPFEGRLATQRRSIGTELGWSLEFVGNLNDLRNHRAFRRVYVDSDLDNWRTDQGPNTAANVFEVTAS